MLFIHQLIILLFYIIISVLADLDTVSENKLITPIWPQIFVNFINKVYCTLLLNLWQVFVNWTDQP